jgi:hypothetical protein
MKKGMAAMITVIVLGALMVMIGSVMVLTSISEGQAVLMETKVKKNQGIIDACTEESMLKINVNGTLPATLVTPLGNCSVTVNSQVGDSWDLNIGANGEMSPLQVNVVFGRGTTMLVSTWLDQ